MAQINEIQGKDEDSHIHKMTVRNHPSQNVNGAVVFTDNLVLFDPQLSPFLNPVNGTNMAVDAGFSGIAAFVYEDGNATSADSGTTDGATTAFKLIQSGQNFNTTVSVGMIVRNTTDTTYAHVTVVGSDTLLTLDADIMATGETYTIGTEWVGTAEQGAWDFTGDISIAAANDNDNFMLETPHTSEMGNYVAVTGNVTLTTWSPASNDLLVSLCFNGVVVGNQVNLNDFIDTGLLGTAQAFVIPKAQLGIVNETVNQLNGFIVRGSGGPKPTIDLDDIQFEKAGGSLVYIGSTPPGSIFHIDQVRINIADNIPSTLTDGTMLGLSYDKLLGLASLTNGINFRRVKEGETSFSATIRNLGDLLEGTTTITNNISDGTNTWITIVVEYAKEIVLNGTAEDFLEFTINDDLSGLLNFTVFARGAVEIQKGPE